MTKEEHMTKVNLLVVERNADWSDWETISRSFNSVLMLVQQADEPSDEFHERILRRMARVDRHALDQVVLLRDRNGARSEPLSAPLLEQIDANARQGLRVYPCSAAT
jgi:hypothetical protein